MFNSEKIRKLLLGSRRRDEKRSRGVTAVETAIVLPVFLILVMGTVELGNFLNVMLTLQKAAQLGSRMAVTGQGVENGTRMSYIVNETEKLLTRLPGEAEVTVTSRPALDPEAPGVEGDAGQPCELVEIRVDYAYETVTPLSALLGLFGGEFADEIPLSQSASKVNEPWLPCS